MISLPMDGEIISGEASRVPPSAAPHRQPRAACARRLEIFLDKVPPSARRTVQRTMCRTMQRAVQRTMHHGRAMPCTVPCTVPCTTVVPCTM